MILSQVMTISNFVNQNYFWKLLFSLNYHKGTYKYYVITRVITCHISPDEWVAPLDYVILVCSLTWLKIMQALQVGGLLESSGDPLDLSFQD